MRTRSNHLVAAVAVVLAGCSSGGTVVVRQPPPPAPLPVVIDPLEVDVTRPHNGKIYVQTNRAAYVAIVEIVPERGATLVYPVSARQRQFVVTGLRDVPVWWEPTRVTYRGVGMSSRSNYTRYIYVVASDEPLRIPAAAFRDGYLHETLGNPDYRARNPYATMRAIARDFVAPVIDQRWAEDAYALAGSYGNERYQVTRVYCRDGSIYEVPADLADHVWCPAQPRDTWDGTGRVSTTEPTGSRRPPYRPDSVLTDNGRRVAVQPPPSPGRGPIQRVKEPPGWDNRANGRGADDNRPGNGRGANDDQPGNGRVKDHPDHPENEPNGRARRPNDGQDDNGPPGQQRRANKPNDRNDNVPPGQQRKADQGNDQQDRVPPGQLKADKPNDRHDDGPPGQRRADQPDNRQNDGPPGQRKAEAKEVMREPPRGTPLRGDKPPIRIARQDSAASPVMPVNTAKPEAPGKPDNQGKSDKPDNSAKPDNSSKPGNSGRADNPGKPDNAGKLDSPVKPDSPVKSDSPVKPDAPAKPDTASATSTDSKPDGKSQGSDDKRGGQGKGRGRPNDDDKSADRKPKPSADSKP